MIVIEGMDNSGKSTLAERMACFMKHEVRESEGPPRSADEINARVDRYNGLILMTPTIFVRHPCISNAIYGQVREEGNPITPDRTKLFYDMKPTLIYCDAGGRGLNNHVEKEHDTKKHLADISAHYAILLYLYRQWAAENAHFVYRIGDDMDALISTVNFFEHFTNLA